VRTRISYFACLRIRLLCPMTRVHALLSSARAVCVHTAEDVCVSEPPKWRATREHNATTSAGYGQSQITYEHTLSERTNLTERTRDLSRRTVSYLSEGSLDSESVFTS